MDKIIHVKVTVPCTKTEAFQRFTVNDMLELWLTEAAEVDPRLGGKYELFWDPENKKSNSTLGCKITAVEEGRMLCFNWKGPDQFAGIMNYSNPLTHVTVFFISRTEKPHSADIHLIHTGWSNTKSWDEARLWQETAWNAALDRPKEL